MTDHGSEPPPNLAPREVIEEAARLWATGMFEDYGEKERDKFAIRVRGYPRPKGSSLWAEALGNHGWPAVSFLGVRHQGERWIERGQVDCVVAGRELGLIPNFSFWDWEQLPDGSYSTLTFTGFDIPETRPGFTAMIEQDDPVLIRVRGGDQVVEFTVDEVELQGLRDVLTIYRAKGGAW